MAGDSVVAVVAGIRIPIPEKYLGVVIAVAVVLFLLGLALEAMRSSARKSAPPAAPAPAALPQKFMRVLHPERDAPVRHAIRRVLVQMMAADGRIEEAEIAAVADKVSQFELRVIAVAGKLTAQRPAVSRDDVLAELEAMRQQPQPIEAYCGTIAATLSEHERERVLAAAQAVAAADGAVDQSEYLLLQRIGQALGVPAARFGELVPAWSPPPAAAVVAPSHPCPTCRAPVRWIAEHARWWCDQCRSYL